MTKVAILVLLVGGCGDNAPESTKRDAAETIAAEQCAFNKRCIPERYAQQYGDDDDACVSALTAGICSNGICDEPSDSELIDACMADFEVLECAGLLDVPWPNTCYAALR